MNYQWHYDRLIETRKTREMASVEYYEKHHILPKSMGGSNDKDNLVYLTAREHFIAHWLLWRIYRNQQMAYAFHSMCNFRNTGQKNHFISSRAYSEAKEVFRQIVSEKMKGNTYCLGYKHTDEARKNFSISHKGLKNSLGFKHSDEVKLQRSEALKASWRRRKENGLKPINRKPHTEETKNKIREANKGKILSKETKEKISLSKQNVSDETRKKISEANKGRKLSDETKKKMSSSRTIRQKEIKNCEFCLKEFETNKNKRFCNRSCACSFQMKNK
jgi:hypothetical protein